MCGVQELIHLGGQLCQHIANAVVVGALVCLHHLVVLPIDGDHNAIDPGVVLSQLPVFGNEELGGLHEPKVYHAVEKILTFGKQGVALLLAEAEKLGFGIIAQVMRPQKILHQGFIGERSTGNGVGLTGGYCGSDFLGQCGDIAADVIQGVLEEYGAVVHLHHEAALRIPAGANGGGVSVYPDAGGLHIHTQNTDIIKRLY